ncbi:MAG: MaoC family dehydratase N-terminal domain-containing protein [Rhodospirillaceae bacterium]|jgi:hypothetical protein
MSLLTPELKACIGLESEIEVACDAVERGAVRRYSQAIMDDDPNYHDEELTKSSRYGAPVAPPLLPMYIFRRDFGTPDPIQENATNPDFDGIVGATVQGLPPLPLDNYALLNAGSEVEFFRYPNHGEKITAKNRYNDIIEKDSRSGPMLLVFIETEYRNEDGELLMRVIKTHIRRPPKEAA